MREGSGPSDRERLRGMMVQAQSLMPAQNPSAGQTSTLDREAREGDVIEAGWGQL